MMTFNRIQSTLFIVVPVFNKRKLKDTLKQFKFLYTKKVAKNHWYVFNKLMLNFFALFSCFET